jgi:hypothetical protein
VTLRPLSPRQLQHRPDPSWHWSLDDPEAPSDADLGGATSAAAAAGGPAGGLSPRDLYWRVWGLVTVLYCSACHVHFPAREQLHCSFHPAGAPEFPRHEAGPGVYSCCGVRTLYLVAGHLCGLTGSARAGNGP